MSTSLRTTLGPVGLALCVPLLFSSCSPSPSSDSTEPGGSVLALLPTEGKRLDVGDEVESTLSSSDIRGADESYLEAWTVEGRPGDTFSIDLISDEFDSYLYVVGPGLEETLHDDDGGGACHARIDFTVLEPGVFHVVVTTLGARETGAFRLRVSETPQPRISRTCGGVNGHDLLELDTDGRTIRIGESHAGRLTGAELSIHSDRPVQAWALEGIGGQTVTIRLESDDFDAYLYLFGPGMAAVETNDDGPSGLDSELTVTFPESGTYVIGAASLREGAIGTYTLRVIPMGGLTEDDQDG